MNKIVLVGCGNVGMAYAYALVNQKVYVDELVLIDINKDKCLGEAMDLNHCMSYSPSKINVKVLITSGNHDSNERLSFGSQIFNGFNILLNIIN